MEMSWTAMILFVWIVNKQKFRALIIISILPLRLISSCLTGFYEDVNGDCIVCPPGTFGVNCSTICPNGTYGHKCFYSCDCMDCDPVFGCLMPDSTSVGMTELVTSTDVPPVEGPAHTVIFLLLVMVLLVVILAIVGCNFAATMVLLLRFSTNLHLPQHQDKTAKESTTRGTIEEIEMSPYAYESPIIPTESQEIRVYTELH